MPLTFDLNKYEAILNETTKELTLFPKTSTELPCQPSAIYGLPGILGPEFEINIHDLILQTQEKAKLEAYKSTNPKEQAITEWGHAVVDEAEGYYETDFGKDFWRDLPEEERHDYLYRARYNITKKKNWQ